ncbi:MAG: phosphohydrolase [Clostridia bacterium]|nr:phosphohydrolase [Clostridia bacterium]
MIDNNRLLHIIGVSRLMKEKANLLGLDEKEMFTLGYLHDFGYEFQDLNKHAVFGGEIMENMGFKHYKEIMYHGDINAEYNSLALDLLNWCDMHIDCKGNFVSFEERLNDIKNRRGEDSTAYKNCLIMVERLRNNEKLKILN